jgi:hypothetical protein
VLYSKGVDVMRVPASGGASVKVFDFTPFKRFAPDVPALVASPIRAAVLERTFENERFQAFAGSPAGPFNALGPPSSLEDFDARITDIQIDGDQIYLHGLTGIRDVAGHPVTPDLTVAETIGARFAGNLQAYTTNVPGEDEYTKRRFIIREVATGSVRVLADLPYSVASFDLRPDGRAVLNVGDDIYDVPPGGPPSAVAKGTGARIAGERIVFARGLNGLYVRDPDGTVRPIGVPTHTLGAFTTNDDRVAFSANNCVYVTNTHDARISRIPRSPCARMELEQMTLRTVPLRRTIKMRLRCIAGPCSGTVDLRSEYRPGILNRPAHFTIPAGHLEHVTVHLSTYGLKTLRGDARRDELGFPGADVFTVDDAGVRVKVPGDGLVFYRPR